MSHTKLKTVELVDMCCGGCGIDFAMPDWFYRARREDGKTFYCPAGCPRAYRESETDRLRREVTRLHSRITHLDDQKQAAERSAAAHKGQATRLRKRVANGVCPCCHRTFTNVARHMASKHPEFAETSSVDDPKVEA